MTDHVDVEAAELARLRADAEKFLPAEAGPPKRALRLKPTTTTEAALAIAADEARLVAPSLGDDTAVPDWLAPPPTAA